MNNVLPENQENTRQNTTVDARPITAKDLVNIFLRRIWIMLLIAIIIGGGSYLYKVLTYVPMYKS
ncbi:MAG: hypothetical protein IJT91_06185, partial [Clostridia bacterium]|nr:hypothetical protein [Clostridia bacterium]